MCTLATASESCQKHLLYIALIGWGGRLGAVLGVWRGSGRTSEQQGHAMIACLGCLLRRMFGVFFDCVLVMHT